MSPTDAIQEDLSRLYIAMHPEVVAAMPAWADRAEVHFDYSGEGALAWVHYSREYGNSAEVVSIQQGADHYADGTLRFDPVSVFVGDTVVNLDDLGVVSDYIRDADNRLHPTHN